MSGNMFRNNGANVDSSSYAKPVSEQQFKPFTIIFVSHYCKLLRWCPLKWYIQFLLGNPIRVPFPQHPSGKLSFAAGIKKALCLLRCLVPTIFFVLFLIDFGDWVVNQETWAGPTQESDVLNRRQSRIIKILAYMRSQFTYFTAATVTGVFTYKAPQFLGCVNRVNDVGQFLRGKTFPSKKLISGTIYAKSLAPVCFLACLSVLRFIYYMYLTGVVEIVSFWDIKKYFIWSFPGGPLNIFEILVLLSAELAPLPIYSFFIFISLVYADCTIYFNQMMDQIVTYIRDSQEDSSTFTSFMDHFAEQLEVLFSKEVALSELLMGIRAAFSTLLFAIILSNSLLLCSILSQSFLAAKFSTILLCIHYAALFLLPSLVLLIIVTVAVILHENRANSTSIWQDLILARQQSQYNFRRRDEGERLLTLLHKVTHQHNSLTIAGTAQVTRAFGVTLLAGFIGLSCFLVERWEHNQTEELSHQLQLLAMGCNRSTTTDVNQA